MADDVLNIKGCSPLKLHSGLIGKNHAICHYSYNLPLYAICTKPMKNTKDKIKRIKVDSLYGKKKHFNAADRKEKQH